MVTQAQVNELKTVLGEKADAYLEAINTERSQVKEAITLLKETSSSLAQRISELEQHHGITLDFNDVMAKFDQGLNSLPNIYDPSEWTDSTSPPTPEPVAV